MFYIKEFYLTDEDLEKIKAWDDVNTGHKCKFHPDPNHPEFKYQGVCGGGLSVIFTPTSIGTFTTIRCGCGAELHLDNDI